MSGETDRLLELETRSMYQEATIAELSRLVASQDERLRRLEESLRSVAHRLKDVAEEKSGAGLPHERPPHY